MGYYTSDEMITYFARQKFMLVIAFEVPDCLNELKQIYKCNYPLFNDLTNKTQKKYPSLKEISNYHNGIKLHELLIKWCQDWHINEIWMVENALITLFSWFDKPDLADQIYFYNNPIKLKEAIGRSIQRKLLMENDPEYPTPGKYEPFFNISRKKYTQLLPSYMDNVEKMHEKYGFKKTIVKKSNPQRHFRWLVQYQLLRWKPEQIIYNYGNEDLSNDSVKKEIRRIASLIELKLL